MVNALCQTDGSLARQTFEEQYLGVALEIPIKELEAEGADTDADTDADRDADADANLDTEDDDTTNEVPIVTSVFYKEKARGVKHGWYVTTDLACELEGCMHSDQKYCASEVDDTLDTSVRLVRGTMDEDAKRTLGKIPPKKGMIITDQR